MMKFIIILLLSYLLCGCTIHKPDNPKIIFTGKWQGSGVDSDGIKAEFVATVIAMGGKHYQVSILEDFSKNTKPMHVMDGILDGNIYSYTADNGKYSGSCELTTDSFKGYYKGPIDGTFILYRIKESN